MIKNYLNFLQESQDPNVEIFRKNHDFMYFYHGTILKNINEIRELGIKTEKMQNYNYPEFVEGGKYYNKKAIWLTSHKTFANAFAIGFNIKAEFFKKYRGPILLVKVYTKFLDYLNPKKLEQRRFDEYVYLKNIPIIDIIWPDDSNYNKVEKKFDYLKTKINRFNFKN